MRRQPDLDDFLSRQRLPADYLQGVQRWFMPLAASLADASAAQARPLLVGIHGCQGSGKSTLAGLLVELLEQLHGLPALALSLDDFYLGRMDRAQLAARVHPLLVTRGVPGTHDVQLMTQALARLQDAASGYTLPRFDKARDERMPAAAWRQVDQAPRVILFEGWCLGVPAQAPAELAIPVNRLESEEDADGRWRAFVNARLREDYQPLFARVASWIMLQAPSFAVVRGWRLEQEQKLADSPDGAGGPRVMTPAGIERFIQHYQRLTEHALRVMPGRVQHCYRLDAARRIRDVMHSPSPGW